MARSPGRDDGGQASVELIAAVPLLVAVTLVAAQLAVVGHGLWAAGVAARAGARAALVGSSPARVARAALPVHLRRGARIGDGEPIRVRVRVPILVPGLPPIRVGASSSLRVAGG